MSEVKPGFWKTEIVIWSAFDPSDVSIQDLCYEADEGSAYPVSVYSTYVPYDDIKFDAQWTPEVNEFYNGSDDE